MRALRWTLWLLVFGSIGCTGGFAIGCGVDGPPTTSGPVEDTGAVAHGDHSPHHDGVVMMKGDLHYEVVLDPAGQYRLYFTDATRADMPASAAANAAITVMRSNEPPEGVELQIDEAGESWVGRGRPVQNPSATTARVAFTIRGEDPYWIDLPFDAKTSATDPHK